MDRLPRGAFGPLSGRVPDRLAAGLRRGGEVAPLRYMFWASMTLCGRARSIRAAVCACNRVRRSKRQNAVP